MKLKLSYQNEHGEHCAVVICEQGGTIGRSADRTLVLKEPSISREHAEIFYQSGQFWIKDTSRAGTYIINKQLKLTHNESAALEHHDLIAIGGLQISAELLEAESAAFHSPFGAAMPAPPTTPTPPAAPAPVIPPPAAPAWEPAPVEAAFPFPSAPPVAAPMPAAAPSFLAAAPPAAEPPPAQAAAPFLAPESNPPLAAPFFGDAFKASSPGFQSPFAAAPETAAEFPAAHPGPGFSASPAAGFSLASGGADFPQASGGQFAGDVLRPFLIGAGLSGEAGIRPEQTEATLTLIGAVFRLMVTGLMETLRARSEIKYDLGVGGTTIQGMDNNPIKFLHDVDALIMSLIKPDNPGFLPPQEAVNQAFRDAMLHQIAMMAGVQAAVYQVIERFDPKHIEEQVGEGVFKKSKCWEEYCQKFPELRNSAVEHFFGEAFAMAYEKKLKSS